jgi:transposase-like protein
MADGRWSCSGCGRKVSATAGTIFDRSRIPLQKWFAAAWYITNQKHGVSALNLQRLLGLGSYQTAWTILQKLRSAMVLPWRQRLHGSVEVNEIYVGGIEHGGRGTESKFIVAIAIEVLPPKGVGYVRLKRVNDVSGTSLVSFINATVEPGTEVRTDGRHRYYGLSEQGYKHHHAIDISSSVDPAHVSLPGVHSVASLLKRWLLSTHQGSLTAEHLDIYLNEFSLRFNHHRRRRGLLFLRLLQYAVVTPPIRYRPSRSLDKIRNHSL